MLSAANYLIGFLRGQPTNLGAPPLLSVIRSILVRPRLSKSPRRILTKHAPCERMSQGPAAVRLFAARAAIFKRGATISSGMRPRRRENVRESAWVGDLLRKSGKSWFTKTRGWCSLPPAWERETEWKRGVPPPTRRLHECSRAPVGPTDLGHSRLEPAGWPNSVSLVVE